jgi:hypothetical protein
MKVPLSEQIEALKWVQRLGVPSDARTAFEAALSTLKWVEKHLAELRVLGEFPIEKIEVLTPADQGSSATSQVGSVEASPLSEGGK